VLNADNVAAATLAKDARARRIYYGVENTAEAHVFVDRDFIWQRTSEGVTPLVPLASIELAGRHMLSNVTAASAICYAAGVGGEAMTRARDDQRRAVRQRFEGDQRGCRGTFH
jgi:UDP-N-acetylmuramoylalanine-D-glutamate ligase